MDNTTQAVALANLGVSLATEQRYDEAHAAYAQALALDPLDSTTWSNLGALHIALRHDAQAESCLRQALHLNAHNAKARFNLAYVLLRQGNWEEGWAAFESRDWYATLAQHFTCPRWQGEPVQGKTLVLCLEAGLGDVIQFCRYANVLKLAGAQAITLVCHPPLKALLQTLSGADSVIAYNEVVPHSGWDYWSPLLSLPFYCNTRLDSIPASTPYLHADPTRTAHWATQLPPRTGAHIPQLQRIGLVWKGNPAFENDAHRSLPSLQTLTPLWAVPGITWIALQKGVGENEALDHPAQLPLLNLGQHMADFADAAAIVSQLDLLISVDTAMAHLAGALGTPCWLLLPHHMPDWRWLATGTTSPWYPQSMRLWRQARAGDWASVVQDVAQELLCTGS